MRQLSFDDVARQADLRVIKGLHFHEMNRIAYRRQGISQLMSQHGQKLIFMSVCLLQSLLCACALTHLTL